MTAFEKIKVSEGQESLVSDEPEAMTTSESKEVETWIDDLVFALRAPLIVWKGLERDTPEDWKHQAQMARMLDLMRPNRERGMCTDLELCFYISGFTLTNVPSHEIGVVYMYAFRKAFGDEMADAIGLERIELNDYPERDLYLRTKRWIYKQQFNHLKRDGNGKTESWDCKKGESGEIQTTFD